MTLIGYPDLAARSTDGRTRLDARSPRNAARGRLPAFLQREFRYSLSIDGHQVWDRRQPRDEPSPRELWVSDDGWSVVRTHGVSEAGLFVLDPLGRKTLTLDVVRDVFGGGGAVPGEVQFTTAGPFWAEDALGLFTEVSGRRHFLLRTRFGRRVVLDLEVGRLIPEDEVPQEPIEAAEREAVLELLREEAASADRLAAVPTTRQLDREAVAGVLEEVAQARAAARAAGQLRLAAAAPSLRALEQVGLEDAWRGCTPLGPGWTIGTRSLRRTTQLALRRVGERPIGDAPYRVGRVLDEEAPRQVQDRDERSFRVGSRRVASEVFELLGAPDFAYDDAWEYDLARRDGRFFTLRIRFGRRGRVTGLERLDPPEWVEGHERERDVFS